MFTGLDSLQKLYLSDTGLVAIDTTVFSQLPRPLELDIHDNPLDCSDRMCWLWEEVEDGSITWFRDGLSYWTPKCEDGTEFNCPESKSYLIAIVHK